LGAGQEEHRAERHWLTTVFCTTFLHQHGIGVGNIYYEGGTFWGIFTIFGIAAMGFA
jgi:hypothetical protein